MPHLVVGGHKCISIYVSNIEKAGCSRISICVSVSNIEKHKFQHTVNIDIFALYIFSRNSRILDIRENMYTSKITFINAQRVKYA